jgi:hypothetical protein
MDQRATNSDDSGSDESARDSDPSPPQLSRRDFATRFGAGSAAAVGLAWASPHISTIRFARKAAVGSPPPTGSTTTTTTSIGGGPAGTISLDTRTPCAGDICHVRADGFAPRTAVSLELDSDEHTLGVTTAGPRGRVNVTVRLPSNMTGPHEVVVVGVQPGGRTLTLSVPVTIKTQAECHVGPQGSTTTTTQPGATTTTGPGNRPTTSTSPTSVPTSTSVAEERTHEAGGGSGGGKPVSNGSGFLAFTGTDSVDLALLGAAAAVGGRALFGLVAHRDEDEDEED